MGMTERSELSICEAQGSMAAFVVVETIRANKKNVANVLKSIALDLEDEVLRCCMFVHGLL